MTTMDAPQLFTDRDGAIIGEAFDLETGTLYALGDGGFMLAVDPVMERSDLESLHRLIGQLLERPAPSAPSA